jgi:hypothetical protein
VPLSILSLTAVYHFATWSARRHVRPPYLQFLISSVRAKNHRTNTPNTLFTRPNTKNTHTLTLQYANAVRKPPVGRSLTFLRFPRISLKEAPVCDSLPIYTGPAQVHNIYIWHHLLPAAHAHWVIPSDAVLANRLSPTAGIVITIRSTTTTRARHKSDCGTIHRELQLLVSRYSTHLNST